jgi:hypothetical protein
MTERPVNSGSTLPERPANERLDSWKEIAAYLRRDVRTVQRWEKRESLPVYRHVHAKLGTVYAHKAELDAWWNNRRPKLEAQENELRAHRHAVWRRLVLALAGVVLTLVVARAVHNFRGNRTPAIEDRISRDAMYDLALREVFFLSDPASVPPSTAPAPAWMPLIAEGAGPGPRSRMAAIYDSARDRLTVFGGYGPRFLNDTWVLIGAVRGERPRWARLEPRSQGPRPRAAHSAVYDRVSNRMVIFGGRDELSWFDDVWVLIHANGVGGEPRWLELRPQGARPAARASHSAVYDPQTDRMVVYGGWSAGGRVLDDVWLLEHTTSTSATPTWRKVSPEGKGPGESQGHASAYDEALDRMLVFGGISTAPPRNRAPTEVWVLENAAGRTGRQRWSVLRTLGTRPPRRTEHSLLYDAAGGRLWVGFGAAHTDEGGSFNLNDLWLLEPLGDDRHRPQWREIRSPFLRPGPRSTQAMAFDAESTSLLLFGGHYGGSRFPVGDLWVLAEDTRRTKPFFDDFAGSELEPFWQVIEGAGTISLRENPGFLRYRALPKGTQPRHTAILRQFAGEDWTIETQATFAGGSSGGGRSVRLGVFFGVPPVRPFDAQGASLQMIHEQHDWSGESAGSLRLTSTGPSRPLHEKSLPHELAVGAVWRIVRSGRSVAVLVSADGRDFVEVERQRLEPAFDRAPQFLSITGHSFDNYNAYLDLNYVRLAAAEKGADPAPVARR